MRPLSLTLECMNLLDLWILNPSVGSLDPFSALGSVDPDRSICGVPRVAVLVWLTSIPRPRLYWSGPGDKDRVRYYQPHSAH